MSIERKVKQAKARYSAIITNGSTAVEALVAGEEVALKVPGARGIVRVPVEDWGGFRALVEGISEAVEEKLQVEAASVALPWEHSGADAVNTPPQPGEALGREDGTFITVPYDGTPVVRDAVTGLPIEQAKPYSLDDPDEMIVPDPIPGVPRVSA